jgi:hypothetical protein
MKRSSKDEGKDRFKKEKLGIKTFDDSDDDEERHQMPGGYSQWQYLNPQVE